MDSIEKLKEELAADAQKAKAEGQELLGQLEEKIEEAPKWKLIPIAILLLFALVYLCWCRVHTPAPQRAVFTPAAPVVTAPKAAGPVLKKPLQVVPKAAVARKFGAAVTLPSNSEVIDTADIPAAPDGVQTVVLLNMSTGTATTQYRIKPAPWFAFEARNTLGAGYRVGSDGTSVPIYYRRDLMRVKDLHLVGELGGKIPAGPGKLEGHAGANLEYRW